MSDSVSAWKPCPRLPPNPARRGPRPAPFPIRHTPQSSPGACRMHTPVSGRGFRRSSGAGGVLRPHLFAGWPSLARNCATSWRSSRSLASAAHIPQVRYVARSRFNQSSIRLMVRRRGCTAARTADAVTLVPASPAPASPCVRRRLPRNTAGARPNERPPCARPARRRPARITSAEIRPSPSTDERGTAPPEKGRPRGGPEHGEVPGPSGRALPARANRRPSTVLRLAFPRRTGLHP